VFQPFEDLRTQAKELTLAEHRLMRSLDRTEAYLVHGDPDHCQITRSSVWGISDAETLPLFTPKVSVVVSLYNYAAVVAETLDSGAASQGMVFEVIVVHDHSRDDSVRVARAALEQYPDLQWTLVERAANRGLAAARNFGVQMATGKYVMIIDADNHVYPRALAALAETLDQQREADATWSILEDFGASRGLRSAVAWDVRRLCEANYLDAQSMWRRESLIALGGYRDDDDLVYGWEDWDLWLRLAHSGGHAVLLPQILGRYRVQEVSMIALTNLARAESIQALRDRYPSLPWPTDLRI
jgi:glycosyltransferase involved in cell wall biosynthesis